MPLLTRAFLRIGLVHLLAGLSLATLVQAQPMLGWAPTWLLLRPTAWHMIFIGWLTQVIMGVALWMFPVASRTQPQGSPWLGWSVLACLNLGLVLRLLAEVALALGPASGAGVLLGPAAILLLTGAWGFAVLIWPRIRTR